MHAHSVMLKPELSSVSKTGPQREGGAVMHLSHVSKEWETSSDKQNMWGRLFFRAGALHIPQEEKW